MRVKNDDCSFLGRPDLVGLVLLARIPCLTVCSSCDCGVWFDPIDSQESLPPVELDQIAKVINAVVSLHVPKGRAVEPIPQTIHNTLESAAINAVISPRLSKGPVHNTVQRAALNAAVSPRLPKGRAVEPFHEAIHDTVKSTFVIHLADRRFQVVANEIELEMFRYVRYNPRNFIMPSITVIQQVWKTIILGNLADSTSLVMDDAAAYLDQIKARFIVSRWVYGQFLFAMKRFKEGMVSPVTLVNFILLYLFKDEPSLVVQFARYLPEYLVRYLVNSDLQAASGFGEREDEQDGHSLLVSWLDFGFMRGYTSDYGMDSSWEVGGTYENEIGSDDDLGDALSVSDSEGHSSESSMSGSEKDNFEDAVEDLV